MSIQVGETSEVEPQKKTIRPAAPERRAPAQSVRATVLALIAAGAGLGFYATEIEPAWIEATHYRLAAPVSPPIKIAHLTDLHTRELGRPERRLLALLEEEKPDLIAITGDATHNDATAADTRALFERLHAPLGVWMARGNWEVWRLTDDSGAFFRSLGIHYLMNENRPLPLRQTDFFNSSAAAEGAAGGAARRGRRGHPPLRAGAKAPPAKWAIRPVRFRKPRALYPQNRAPGSA